MAMQRLVSRPASVGRPPSDASTSSPQVAPLPRQLLETLVKAANSKTFSKRANKRMF